MAPSSNRILFKATAAEFLGTALFLFTTISAVTSYGAGVLAPIGVAAVFGLTIFVLEIGLGETCGGHFNPAVSLGVFINGGMGYLQFIAYWLAQVLGAITGACFARLCVGDPVYEANGRAINIVGTGHSTGRAFLAEVIATGFLVLVVLQTAGTKRNKKNRQARAWAPLAIGLVVLVDHLALVSIDGCSINPARSLGAATAGWSKTHASWNQMWIFVIAPLVGGAVAGLFKRVVIPWGDKAAGVDEEAAPASGDSKV
ncbi:aquaporin [Klebsormidium nitens]|uniref:Aquaporin n=1 Tax=Klebsormidium nitens TaxID=105231 RepID=A0A1Y1HU59_KLENI|nr:aquaporin [Klebsormidium nitens]|eukprot:GAQ80531.1 aquaporin [Klebsormidium nitens]